MRTQKRVWPGDAALVTPCTVSGDAANVAVVALRARAMRTKALRGSRSERSAARRQGRLGHVPACAPPREAAAAWALQSRLQRASSRRSVACAAVAELEAPPAQTGLQLEVTFEEPDAKVPVTFITTTSRVVSSASSLCMFRLALPRACSARASRRGVRSTDQRSRASCAATCASCTSSSTF